ncbi:MAG: hypothetical protein K8L97_19285 [Anaerolineae bacterium]|nr:hypothetical protein [Anaerolineae bacterium]
MPIVKDKYRGSKEYHLVYSELINAARNRGKTTYQQIAEIMGLPLSGNHMGLEVGQMLGEISEDENNQGRPMLSSVVTRADGSVGDGFFALARDFGKLTDDTPEGKERFCQTEREKVYTVWQKSFKK